VSDNRFVFDGLAELREDLRTLPARLAGEGSGIVQTAANDAAQWIRDRYGAHRVTGTLQSGVKVTTKSVGQFGAGMVVRSTAPHAHLFEYGTEARHYVTKAGKEHKTGAVPRHPPSWVFIPVVMQKRREMYERLKQLLQDEGLR
jgi:hypothetical protein